VKIIINAITLILVLLSTSIYAFSDEYPSPYPNLREKISLYVGGTGPYVKIETLDFSSDYPFLEYLSLKPIYTIATKKDLEDVNDDMGLSNNLKLKSLDVDGSIFGKILSSTDLPNLKSLTILSSARDVSFFGFPNLTKISFVYSDFTYETFESLSQLPHLETLTFKIFANDSIEHFNDESIELLGYCQNLKTIHITTKSAKSGYIKERLKAVLPNADIRVGWRRDF